jgi:hypothetical protein
MTKFGPDALPQGARYTIVPLRPKVQDTVQDSVPVIDGTKTPESWEGPVLAPTGDLKAYDEAQNPYHYTEKDVCLECVKLERHAQEDKERDDALAYVVGRLYVSAMSEGMWCDIKKSLKRLGFTDEQIATARTRYYEL